MTRIIAGAAGGRRLQVPAGRDTRPTSDRVREALFSRLDHEGWLDGARVLDLYAGSGALGLEAASRGAAEVVLVESARPAAATIRRNVAALGLVGVRVAEAKVERWLDRPAEARFEVVLADPPYPVTDDAVDAVLHRLVEHGWLADQALVVVERASRSHAPHWPAPLEAAGDRAYGETRLWFAERT
ncbi:16S rRNA (guanine(966)-N(2))-methyltransferase RsmD [Angustibacter sp. Root456]|uniref:16S rRNA (guanine(966)-N(2))-methyltransferase RsmD n=1 Tax=Angustibacter sp. Root456 TaxID=1736539 RepID=UPI0006F6CF3E|nr:16S rRNA (guanine(966)-N(2))-methyltransferase RsmD [Angustibacter sp. Root456]KQX69573.1 16S rRNA (guanine(966)-N(2))-methyltransferase RsmD [Angustibacter sp. Root456]